MPVASAMMRSCEASRISSVRVERPSCITITRSLMPSTSSNSLEIMMIDTPRSASSFISL